MLVLCVLPQPPPFQLEWNLVHLSGEGLRAARERSCHWGTVIEAREMLPATPDGASTKLVRIDISRVRRTV